jgi:hypothetical protein
VTTPTVDTIAAAARAAGTEAWRAVPPSAPEAQPGYVGRILRRYAVGLVVAIVAALVLRVAVVAPWKERMTAEFAKAMAEAQTDGQTQAENWTPNSTTPPDSWGVTPPPGGLNAAPRDAPTPPPKTPFGRPDGLSDEVLLTRLLGAMCFLAPVAIVLALFVHAFFVWLSAMALQLGRRFSTAFYAAAVAFGLSIAASVMLFLTFLRGNTSQIGMQAVTLGALALAGALGVKLVYRAPLWLSICAALFAGVMNAVASLALQLAFASILLA